MRAGFPEDILKRNPRDILFLCLVVSKEPKVDQTWQWYVSRSSKNEQHINLTATQIIFCTKYATSCFNENQGCKSIIFK